MTTVSHRRGVFPGSFNPLTIAHLEISRLAMRAHDLDEVHLVLSRVALDKPAPPGPSFDQRIEILEADASAYDWLHIGVTDQQLIAEIAAGFEVVIMGADKWKQVHEVKYYDDAAARDDALASLPTVVVAERAGIDIAGVEATVLRTPKELHDVSSTAARAGARELMAPQAALEWNDGAAAS